MFPPMYFVVLVLIFVLVKRRQIQLRIDYANSHKWPETRSNHGNLTRMLGSQHRPRACFQKRLGCRFCETRQCQCGTKPGRSSRKTRKHEANR